MHFPISKIPALWRSSAPDGPGAASTGSWGSTRARTSGRVNRRSRWHRVLLRTLWMGFSIGVLLYSLAVLAHVAWMGTIGVRCLFGTKVEETIPSDYEWDRSRPRVGDSLEAIGSHVI